MQPSEKGERCEEGDDHDDPKVAVDEDFGHVVGI
jgi:hypothetical protein